MINCDGAREIIKVLVVKGMLLDALKELVIVLGFKHHIICAMLVQDDD